MVSNLGNKISIFNWLQPLNLFQVPMFDSQFQDLNNYKLS
jgi:hypothetical protein